MKNVITLFIAATAFISGYAQTSKDEARKVILGQEKGTSSTSRNDRDVILGGSNEKNYPDSYPNNYPTGSHDAQVDQVNREYDAKIRSIQNNRTLTQAEKDRMIRQLEKDRAKKIRQVDRNGDDDYGDNEKKEKDHKKSNNGKHLGWEKGKGNPHKNGGKPGKR